MDQNRFVNHQEIEELLENFVLYRDFFLQDRTYNFWKTAYENVKSINIVLEARAKRWKGTPEAKTISEMKKHTNSFLKKIRKRGQLNGNWCGESDECKDLIQDYRKECIPLIKELTKYLNPESPCRISVEQRLQA